MFQKLQDKWKVSGLDFLLIFLTFAIGGSLCGYAGKKIMGVLGIEKGLLWAIFYIIVLTLIWPLCVLFTSLFFGQFSFFKKYIGKMLGRLRGKTARNSTAKKVSASSDGSGTINIAIFASGTGTNAARIISHFKNNAYVKVVLVVCNKPGAGVLTIAADNGIDTLMLQRERFFHGDAYTPELRKYEIHWIILAGFLWKVPNLLIQGWRSRIINIHPALLPHYGGKGMYGKHVHEAVIAAGDQQSGISIHYVDEIYDHGELIMQARCNITPSDTADTLAAKIHLLEHEHFPVVIEKEIMKLLA